MERFEIPKNLRYFMSLRTDRILKRDCFYVLDIKPFFINVMDTGLFKVKGIFCLCVLGLSFLYVSCISVKVLQSKHVYKLD